MSSFFNVATSPDSLSARKMESAKRQFINTDSVSYYATIISDSTIQALLPPGAIACIAISSRRLRVTPLLETCVPFPEEAGACGHKKGHSFLWTVLYSNFLFQIQS